MTRQLRAGDFGVSSTVGPRAGRDPLVWSSRVSRSPRCPRPTLPPWAWHKISFGRRSGTDGHPSCAHKASRGRAGSSVLPDDLDWSMLGFQTSTGSTSDVAKFTINLMVVGKGDWERARETHPWYTLRPSPNTVALHRYEQRLGFLTHGRDHWWLLRGDGKQPGSRRRPGARGPTRCRGSQVEGRDGRSKPRAPRHICLREGLAALARSHARKGRFSAAVRGQPPKLRFIHSLGQFTVELKTVGRLGHEDAKNDVPRLRIPFSVRTVSSFTPQSTEARLTGDRAPRRLRRTGSGCARPAAAGRSFRRRRGRRDPLPSGGRCAVGPGPSGTFRILRRCVPRYGPSK